jgi:hypothetical protein
MRRTIKARGGSMREEPTRRLGPQAVPSHRRRTRLRPGRAVESRLDSAAPRQGQKPSATVQLVLQASPHSHDPPPAVGWGCSHSSKEVGK